MTTTAPSALPMILDEVEVVRVDRLSPSFVRVELAGPGLAEFGVDGPLYDQRIKLIFPGASGRVPSFVPDDSWYDAWLALPDDERGHLRTYTVRALRGQGLDTRVVVDIVVHPDEHGEAGPGCAWGRRATVGDRLVLIGPRRGAAWGGIEFDPGTAGRLLLVGDETALPAIAAILGELPWQATGAAFIEVPHPADVQTVRHPEGVEVVWLVREGAPHGAKLHTTVLEHLGARSTAAGGADEVDPDLWETPSYSSSGEDVGAIATAVGHDLEDLYAWIAGEAGLVTGLRRVLVSELGMDRRQVAFMGYWRRGVPMRG